MTIPQLYYALDDQHLRANVKGFAPSVDRAIINQSNQQRAFGKNPVRLDIPANSLKMRFDTLDDSVAYLWRIMGPDSPMRMMPYDEKRCEVMVRFFDVLGNEVLGVLSELTRPQYHKLLEQYKG